MRLAAGTTLRGLRGGQRWRWAQVRGIQMLRDLPVPTAAQRESKPRLEPVKWVATPSAASHRLSAWTSPPRTMLLVQKVFDERVTFAMGGILGHMREHYPQIQLIVEPHTAREHPEHEDHLIVVEPSDFPLLPAFTHLVLTLGGDGTVLHTSNLFSQGECPPVLSFSMGSLGFLLPFHINALGPALETTINGPVSILNRLRLACTPMDERGNLLERFAYGHVGENGFQVMNEVTLHRGRHPHLTVVDASFDGQHLTEAVADGLLLSTPTGSTAYSLSAGGPISHPEVDAVLLTPVAPRSLSFRTVILPANGTTRLSISPRTRSPVELSIDGKNVGELNSHESVLITKSPFPIPCVERSNGETGWVKDINQLLQFNVGFVNKSLQGHET